MVQPLFFCASLGSSFPANQRAVPRRAAMASRSAASLQQSGLVQAVEHVVVIFRPHHGTRRRRYMLEGAGASAIAFARASFLTCERVKAGLAAARARGRKPILTAQQIAAARKILADPETTIKEVADTFRVNRATIYSALGPASFGAAA